MDKNLNIRLRHMRVFAEILRVGSLAKAAQVLYVTPAAISKSLRELEAQVGVKLLERSRSGVRPTLAGERFHEHITDSLLSYNRAVAAVTETGVEAERLSIGALPTAAGSIVPEALARMYSESSRANINVETGNYEDLAAKLRAREVDLIVGRITTRDTAGLSFEQLYEESVIAVVSASHPLIDRGLSSLNEISVYPTIVTPSGSTVRQSIDDFFFAAGIRSQSLLIETLGDGFARRHTMLTNAVWFTPAGLAEHDIESGTLTRLPLDHATLRTVIGLTTRTNEALTGAARQFADIVREITAQNRPAALQND